MTGLDEFGIVVVAHRSMAITSEQFRALKNGDRIHSIVEIGGQTRREEYLVTAPVTDTDDPKVRAACNDGNIYDVREWYAVKWMELGPLP